MIDAPVVAAARFAAAAAARNWRHRIAGALFRQREIDPVKLDEKTIKLC